MWMLYITLISSVFLVVYYLMIFGRLLFYKASPHSTNSDFPVSIIICARNEEANLRTNLVKIIKQDYHGKFEVLVIDDHSSDHSLSWLKQLSTEYDKLRVIPFRDKKKFKGKKEALAFGISQAKYDYILLTDADCQPASPHWLQLMSGSLTEKELVLGFGAYKPQAGLTNKLLRWETLQTAMQYMSLALAGSPYMGVGRNLAYKRQLFTSTNGFQDHQHIASGDDDLFISNVSNADNTGIMAAADSFTWSEGPGDLVSWWRQKRRHLSTGPFYKKQTKLILGLYSFMSLLFYMVLLSGIFLGTESTLFWLTIISKFIIQSFVFIPLAIRFRCKEILWLFPVWELLVTFFLVLIHLQNQWIGNPKTWK